MKKYYALVALAIAVIIITIISRSSSTKNEIRVGAILPLSGDLSYIGDEMERGMRIALEDYKDVPIKLSIEDDHSLDTRTSVNALNKLIATGYDDIILNDTVNATKGLSPVVAAHKIPLVVLWDSSNELLSLSKWVMSMGFSLEAAGEDIATYAYNDLEFRKIAIEAAQDEWSNVVSASFEEKFNSLGGTIVLHEKTPISQPDFKTNIIKAKEAGAESIYLPHYPQGNSLITRQARDLGFKGPLLSGDVFDESAIESLGEYAKNVYVAQLWLTDDKFKAKYGAAYGESPSSINLAFAAIGYDGIRLVAETYKGLEANGVKNPTGEQIRDYIKTLKFDGLTGRTEFDSKGRSHKRERILKVENGVFHLVQ